MRHKRTNTATLAARFSLLVLLAGCNSQSEPPVDAVAVVNGQAVTQSELVAFMQVRGKAADDAAAREAALDELIDLYLLADAARQGGLIDDQTRAQIRVQELSLLANKALSRFAQGQAVSDDAVRAEYQRQVDLTGETEYRIKHVLVPEQMQAVALIDRLNQGESFEQLVGDAVDNPNVGDLGWVNLAQVPQSFASVLRALTPGQYSGAPVSSEYGWHVLFLEATRDFTPPAMENVEEGIRNALSRARLESYLGDLRRSGQIQRQPDGSG